MTQHLIEVTVRRNMQPRTRPQNITIEDTPGWHTGARLYPDTNGRMWIDIEVTGVIDIDWLGLRAQLIIDGMPLCSPRPGVVWLGTTDIPSGLIQYPSMAPHDNQVFGGWHTVVLRRA